jgi:hypothetical protein
MGSPLAAMLPAGKARIRVPEPQQRIYPAHFAPELAAALLKLGWRPVTGRSRPGRTGCHWISPELPKSPQRALWERRRCVHGGVTGEATRRN